MAYAGFRYNVRPKLFFAEGVLKCLIRFAEKVIKASKGEKGIVEPTYVYLPGVSGGEAIAKETGVDYFSVPIELGVRVKEIPLPKMIAKMCPAVWSRKGHQHPFGA